MNIRKRLKQEAKSTHQQILEESDKTFFSSLQGRVSKPKRHSLACRWKLWLAGAACMVSATIIVICVIMFLPNNQRVIYYEENFQTCESDIATLNSDLNEFQIDLGDDFVFSSLKRTIDSLSGDLLFYEALLHTVDYRIQTNLTIVCNQNYDCNLFSEESSSTQVKLPHYSVFYHIEPTLKALFQNQVVQATAKVQGKNEIIYFTNYREMALDGNGTLLGFIQSLIKIKE